MNLDEFDEALRKRAREEPFPIPEDFAGRVFQTCAALEDAPAPVRQHRSSRYWGSAVAAVLVLFLALPNLSPTAAAAMRDIPGLGAIVEIITFRDYHFDDGHASADAAVPVLGGSSGAEAVNRQVEAYTDALLAEFREDCAAAGEQYQSLNVSSAVVTNSETWFTLRLDVSRAKGSGYGVSRFYHIDKATGEQMVLADLFRPDAEYVQPLSAEVRRQLEERQAQDGAYFPEAFTAIAPDQNFYFDPEGRLVLTFDEYAVAAGAAGMPEFTIPAEVYAGLLRP